MHFSDTNVPAYNAHTHDKDAAVCSFFVQLGGSSVKLKLKIFMLGLSE